MARQTSDGKIGYSAVSEFGPSDILYMLKDLPDACCIFKVLTDPFGTVKDMLFLFANEKYASLVGRPSAELIGSTYYSSVSNNDEDWIKYSYHAAILRQSTISRTYNTQFDKWFEFWAVPVYQKGFCAFIIHDVTAAKKDEEENVKTSNTNDLVIECAKVLYASDFGKGIKKALKLIGQTFEADRVFIVEGEDVKHGEFYEWVSSSRPSELPPRKTIEKYNILEMWKQQLKGKGLVKIDDTSNMKISNEEAYKEVLAGRVSRYILTELKDKQDVIGYMVVDNYALDLRLDVEEMIKTVAIFLAAEIRNNNLSNEMMYLGSHDALTGLGNRYSLNQTLGLLSNMSICAGVCYSDINGLKTINDEQGHVAGDSYIKEAAELFSSIFKGKFCYRIGGDEFIAIVPEIEEDKFDGLVKKLRGKTKQVSLSIGSVWIKDSKDINKAIKKADEEMYRDKTIYYQDHERRHKKSNPLKGSK
ncbi:sensor domain-containing diguanylate cyclase [Butyrivibrio proteoclasticus]|uniref:sensor domain-containing diguanylate cyclase n=1 Tax=Butyrivibrio proteoclasticus TaxID=43305 RepID=UPI000557FAC9|nr:diguanylate cyclase [Butyrivibrio proteoclasticus]